MLIIKLESDACFLPSNCPSICSAAWWSHISLGGQKFLFCGWGWTCSCETSANSPGPPARAHGNNPPGKMGKELMFPVLSGKDWKINQKTIAAASPSSFLQPSLSVRGALRNLAGMEKRVTSHGANSAHAHEKHGWEPNLRCHFPVLWRNNIAFLDENMQPRTLHI